MYMFRCTVLLFVKLVGLYRRNISKCTEQYGYYLTTHSLAYKDEKYISYTDTGV
jgi:hypothetical protein